MVTTAKQPPTATKYPLMTAAEMSRHYNKSRKSIDSYLWYHHVRPSGTKHNAKTGKDEHAYAITPEIDKAMSREPVSCDWLRSVPQGEVKDMVLDERRGKSLIDKQVTVQMKHNGVVFAARLVSYNMCQFVVRHNGFINGYWHSEAKVVEEVKND